MLDGCSDSSYLRQDSCAVIRDCDVSVRRNENFIKPTRPLEHPALRKWDSQNHSLGVQGLTNDVLTIFATVLAARIWDLTASFPCCLFFFPWLLIIQPCKPPLDPHSQKVLGGKGDPLSDNNEWAALLILHHRRCKTSVQSSSNYLRAFVDVP